MRAYFLLPTLCLAFLGGGCILGSADHDPSTSAPPARANDSTPIPPAAIMSNNEGLLAITEKRYEQAVRHFENAIRLSDGVAVYFNNLGRAWYYLNDLERSLAVLQHAMSLDPEDAAVRANIGDVFRQQERYDEAVRFYHAAIELAGGDVALQARVNYELGNLYLKRETFDSAEYRLNRALRLDEDFDRARLARLILYHLTQRPHLAIRDLELLEKRGYDVSPNLRDSVIRSMEARERQKNFRPGY